MGNELNYQMDNINNNQFVSLVLAGANYDDKKVVEDNKKVERDLDIPNKAFLKFEIKGEEKSILKKSMLEIVVEALLGSKYIKSVFVGYDHETAHPKKDEHGIIRNIQQFQSQKYPDKKIYPIVKESGVEEVIKAFLNNEHSKDIRLGDYVLISTSDMPLINSGIIDSFLEKIVLDKEAYNKYDIFIPIASEKVVDEYFKEYKEYNLKHERKFPIKLKEGNFRNGNLFLIKKRSLKELVKQGLITPLYEGRRKGDKPYLEFGLKQIKRIGILRVLYYGIKYLPALFKARPLLNIKDLENLSERIGYKTKLVRLSEKEVPLVLDVDTKQHYEEVKNVLSIIY